MAESNLETDSTFTCVICLDHPKDLLTCRHCSTFVCTFCIDKWVQQSANNGISTCPLCRQPTERSEFIRLAWLPDHREQINDRIKEFERTKMNECSQHVQQGLCIYCSTCSKAICAQCILPMFNGEHTDHAHFRLDAAQQRLLKAMNEKEKYVQSDLEQLDKFSQNPKVIVNRILASKNERLNELEEFQTNIKNEIEVEVIKVLKKFHDEQNVLIAERTDYQARHIQLKKTIESYNQIELFQQEKELFQQISQRAKLPRLDLSADMIESPLTLPWQTGEFVIEQFSIKRQLNNRISSHQIQLDHNQYWTLTIYPNGKGPHTGVDLSIILQLSKGMSQWIDYTIIIELIHHHHDDNEHNYPVKITQSLKEGQSSSYDQFYKLNDLSINGFLNPTTDSIKFRFKLRPTSILEEKKLLQWQIESFNRTEQNREMKKIKDELTRRQQQDRQTSRVIEDQRIYIKELERHNCELKRKRTQSNHDEREDLTNQKDRRSESDQRKTVIFGSEKRFRN